MKRLTVMVVNRGSYTITRIEGRFSYDGKSLVSHAGYRRLSGFGQVRPLLRKDWSLAGWAGGRTREAWLIWRRRSTVGTPILWRGVLLGAGLLALVLVLLHH